MKLILRAIALVTLLTLNHCAAIAILPEGTTSTTQAVLLDRLLDKV